MGRAIFDCQNNGFDIGDQFAEVEKLIEHGKSDKRKNTNYKRKIFEKIIERIFDIKDQFPEVGKLIKHGKSGKRKTTNYKRKIFEKNN